MNTRDCHGRALVQGDEVHIVGGHYVRMRGRVAGVFLGAAAFARVEFFKPNGEKSGATDLVPVRFLQRVS